MIGEFLPIVALRGKVRALRVEIQCNLLPQAIDVRLFPEKTIAQLDNVTRTLFHCGVRRLGFVRWTRPRCRRYSRSGSWIASQFVSSQPFSFAAPRRECPGRLLTASWSSWVPATVAVAAGY